MRWWKVSLAVALALIVWAPGARAGTRDEVGVIGGACRSAAEHPASEPPIVRRVCRDLPALARRGISDLRAVELVRDWAFRTVVERPQHDTVLDDGTGRFTLPPDAWKKSASELLRTVEDGRLGARCGDVAWFLMRVYDAFGLEAYIYNFGFPDETAPPVNAASHVITLVRIDRDLVPEDAHFNQTIRGADGALLDVAALLDRLREGGSDAIRFVRPHPFPDRQVLVPETSYRRLRSLIGTPGTAVRGLHDCERRGGHRHCRDSRYTYDSVDERDPSFGTPALDRIAAAGWPRSVDYLMMFPIGVSSDADGWTSYERIGEPTPTAAVLRGIDRAVQLSG